MKTLTCNEASTMAPIFSDHILRFSGEVRVKRTGKFLENVSKRVEAYPYATLTFLSNLTLMPALYSWLNTQWMMSFISSLIKVINQYVHSPLPSLNMVFPLNTMYLIVLLFCYFKKCFYFQEETLVKYKPYY